MVKVSPSADGTAIPPNDAGPCSKVTEKCSLRFKAIRHCAEDEILSIFNISDFLSVCSHKWTEDPRFQNHINLNY